MAHIRIVNVDFTKLPDGQGLYEVGHFRMNTQIHSMGNVSIMASEFPAMSTVVLDMVTKTEVLGYRHIRSRDQCRSYYLRDN